MPWSVTTDVRELEAAAGAFLAAEPVDNTALLTEMAYLAARPTRAEDQLFGWWSDAGRRVAGAFVQAPRHAPVLSGMPDEAVVELMEVLPRLPGLGVPARLVGAVVAAAQRVDTRLAPRHALTVHRLTGLRPPAPPDGGPRIADRSDRDLLVRWFDDLMARHPDDPSDRAYVIDDPLDHGGIVLWEVAQEPVAMCGRSRAVAGMVRLGPVHQPADGTTYADAAFVAACREASGIAEHVLVLTSESDEIEAQRLAALGFVPAAGRVMLVPTSDTGPS